MHDAEYVVRDITGRLERGGRGVHAFWFKVPTERRGFGQEILHSRGSTPIVPLVVRGSLFQNANAVLDDLAALIKKNRAEFDALPRSGNGVIDRCAILLLAHTELSLPQVSSPAFFPDWFPVGGGREVSITIVDLTWRVEAPLSEALLRVEEISAALVRLERVLLERIEIVRSEDHRPLNGLFDLIRQGKESVAEFLCGARAELDRTRADTFRPSARVPRSLTARIWILVRTSTPDQLNGRAEALARALAFPDPPPRMPYESLLTVIGRPTYTSSPASVRMARNILTSTFASCQVLTAVHHAGDYADYPLTLMRPLAFDLLKALATSEEVVAKLSQSA